MTPRTPLRRPGQPRRTAGPDLAWRLTRGQVLRDAAGVAIATGAYGISFGAIALAGGLDFWQTMALSLLMFTGGSQFGLIGVVAGGGAPLAGAATAIMLGARNALVRAPALRAAARSRRAAVAGRAAGDRRVHCDVDRPGFRSGRPTWVSTRPGSACSCCWNIGTAVGRARRVLAVRPTVAGPGRRRARRVPGAAGPSAARSGGLGGRPGRRLVALITVPFVPVGFPVLIAALVGRRCGPVAAAGPDRRSRRSDRP